MKIRSRLFLLLKFIKYHMCGNIVKYKRCVIIVTLKFAEQYAECDGSVVHLCNHSFIADFVRFKCYVDCFNSAFKVPRTVNSAVIIFTSILYNLCNSPLRKKLFSLPLRLSPTLLARLSENGFRLSYNLL